MFDTPAEYEDFIALLDHARQTHHVEVLAFCVMPNHFHLVAKFEETSLLSGMMQNWLTKHVRRHHTRRETIGEGHIWQDRFKCFPIQEDHHLLTVCRYVLMNPVRARLSGSPWEWRWSSLWFDAMLARWPVEPPLPMREWLATEPHAEDGDEGVRTSIRRGAPYGDPIWSADTARRWGIESTLTAHGRPKTEDSDELVLVGHS